MTVWGWLLLIAGILAAFCAGIAFLLAQIATARHIGPSWLRIPTPWDAHRDEVRREVAWFEAQEPENVEIISRDGLRLCGRYLAREGSGQAILLMHGYRAQNGESDFAPVLRFYHEVLGMSVLVIDERAHGASEGSRICFGLEERFDCAQWLEWLDARARPQDLFLAGLSMGAATALMATELEPPENLRCVIADCAYTSPWDICEHVLKRMYHMPVWPFLPIAGAIIRRVVGADLREAGALNAMRRNLSVPVLFIHGARDRFVPTDMGRMNHDACRADKRLVIVPAAAHAMSLWEDAKGVKAEISAFIARHSTV